MVRSNGLLDGTFRISEMSWYSILEKSHEDGVHKFKFVRNIETDHSLVLEVLLKLRAQPVSVRLLHYEDDVRPLEELRRNGRRGIVPEASRRHFDFRPSREHLLR